MIISEDKTFNVLKYDLSRYLPIRVVLRKVDDGSLQGLCEDSFSISTMPGNIRIWWSGKAYSFLGEHQLNGIEDAEYNAREGDLVIDPLADDSPIEVDWDRWLKSTGKYSKRNAPFRFKEASK
jgi:hypothetical protein